MSVKDRHRALVRPMKKTPLDEDAGRVDAAFNRVLEVEAEARAHLEVCRREAAELVAAAEERARRIERRTEARMLTVHRRADAAVDRARDSLSSSRTEWPDADPGLVDPPRLDRAVRALVEEIVGAAPSPEPDEERDP
ncbi:hypothetical protein [Imhoffiella purpurea]|uniref:Uncharacterized protein n=1 Tax=Imhoffiella purpurea TaxID=1249627 RepID=W9VDK7_9GAMM|nr:hypothetical protein [Imhoffiella purpurea]EXJ14127.1 hypothetical protein D779_2941 [Imhoffiella purpurea]